MRGALRVNSDTSQDVRNVPLSYTICTVDYTLEHDHSINKGTREANTTCYSPLTCSRLWERKLTFLYVLRKILEHKSDKGNCTTEIDP